jgi:hypothetical protein
MEGVLDRDVIAGWKRAETFHALHGSQSGLVKRG